jgi:hypothetical protein
VPAGIPGHQLAGIPCHATMRHAASAVLSALCAQRRCMRKRGRVTAGAELVRLNRPSSTSPGGKVQCGHYWTRRGAPGMRPVQVRTHHTCLTLPASASATPAFPARARWKMAPAPGRPPRLAGRASDAIAVACRALPRPERLRGPVPTGSAVTQCARCQRPRGASTGMPVLALWGREWQPIMMTETPRPGRSTQGTPFL